MDIPLHDNQNIPQSDDSTPMESSSILSKEHRRLSHPPPHHQYHKYSSSHQVQQMKDISLGDVTKTDPSKLPNEKFVDDQRLSNPKQPMMDLHENPTSSEHPTSSEDATLIKAQAFSPEAPPPPGQQPPPPPAKDPKATTTTTSSSSSSSTSTTTSTTTTKKTTATKDSSKPTNKLPALDDKSKAQELPPNTRAQQPPSAATADANDATPSFISLPPGSDLGKIGELGQIGVFSGSSSSYSPNQFLLMICLGFFIIKMFLSNNNNSR